MKNFEELLSVNFMMLERFVNYKMYLDKNGRTVLFRRFNRNDWAVDCYKKAWSEMLPENEKLTVNGETYVHWYDCISTYIL